MNSASNGVCFGRELWLKLWYNAQMASGELRDFIAARPHLIWYSKNYDRLEEGSIVEHVLNYGTWDDVQELIRIVGIERTANIFRTDAFRQRTNYRKQVRNYFKLYFDKYAHAT